MSRTVVFIHGWSVTDTSTYGGLPTRLAAEGLLRDEALDLRDVWLGRYVSFRDEVRMEDLSHAFEKAVRRELADVLARGERFGVITHSTGGPVARDWWLRYYASRRGGEACPMSHLVMLAPANFGSALAQLGKSRVGRLKSWFEGVEPGQGVLDWLEHGSPEAWDLNEAWIRGRFGKPEPSGVFPFVLTGQTINRKLYDHVNSYTGEIGSDGVVRVPAANLNAQLLRLTQRGPGPEGDTAPTAQLEIVGGRVMRAPRTAFRLISGASHSGEERGILRSVEPTRDGRGAEVVDAVRRCLSVRTAAEYDELTDAFATETASVHERERVEIEDVRFFPDRVHIHDRMSLLIFRLRDSAGYPVEDFDLELTGFEHDPNLLPHGFFEDRQRNQRARHTLTYFVHHDVMAGCPVIADPRGGPALRPTQPGVPTLGLRIRPRPQDGFVHFLPCEIEAQQKLVQRALLPDQTTLVDIELVRARRTGVFRLSRAPDGTRSFADDPPGAVLED